MEKPINEQRKVENKASNKDFNIEEVNTYKVNDLFKMLEANYKDLRELEWYFNVKSTKLKINIMRIERQIKNVKSSDDDN